MTQTHAAPSHPPRIASFSAPTQVVSGSQIELRWSLGGGAPARVTLNGEEVSGGSATRFVSGDPAHFTLEATNGAGTARRELWIGTHAADECVSDALLVARSGQLENPRWLQESCDADRFAHGESARLEVDAGALDDGALVAFVIEHETSQGWQLYDTKTARVASGVASVDLPLFHPVSAARGGKASRSSQAARFRFHARPA